MQILADAPLFSFADFEHLLFQAPAFGDFGGQSHCARFGERLQVILQQIETRNQHAGKREKTQPKEYDPAYDENRFVAAVALMA